MSGQPPGVVSVRTFRPDDGTKRILVTLTDDGEGIAGVEGFNTSQIERTNAGLMLTLLERQREMAALRRVQE